MEDSPKPLIPLGLVCGPVTPTDPGDTHWRTLEDLRKIALPQLPEPATPEFWLDKLLPCPVTEGLARLRLWSGLVSELLLCIHFGVCLLLCFLPKQLTHTAFAIAGLVPSLRVGKQFTGLVKTAFQGVPLWDPQLVPALPSGGHQRGCADLQWRAIRNFCQMQVVSNSLGLDSKVTRTRLDSLRYEDSFLFPAFQDCIAFCPPQ